MKDVSAHDLTRIRLCVEPLCPNEAQTGSPGCVQHNSHAQGHGAATKRNRATPWSRTEAITALQTVARTLDRCPSSAEVVGHADLPSQPTYSKLFGGWGAYCEAADLEPPVRKRAALREAAAARSDEAERPAAVLNVRTIRLRVIQRVAAIREEIDAMERELLDALEEEAA